MGIIKNNYCLQEKEIFKQVTIENKGTIKIYAYYLSNIKSINRIDIIIPQKINQDIKVSSSRGYRAMFEILNSAINNLTARIIFLDGSTATVEFQFSHRSISENWSSKEIPLQLMSQKNCPRSGISGESIARNVGDNANKNNSSGMELAKLQATQKELAEKIDIIEAYEKKIEDYEKRIAVLEAELTNAHTSLNTAKENYINLSDKIGSTDWSIIEKKLNDLNTIDEKLIRTLSEYENNMLPQGIYANNEIINAFLRWYTNLDDASITVFRIIDQKYNMGCWVPLEENVNQLTQEWITQIAESNPDPIVLQNIIQTHEERILLSIKNVYDNYYKYTTIEAAKGSEESQKRLITVMRLLSVIRSMVYINQFHPSDETKTIPKFT